MTSVEDQDRIHSSSDAELDAILDRTHNVADKSERLAVFEEIHRRNKNQTAKQQKTQEGIKKIAAWTLVVGIIVLILAVYQLLK